MPWILNKRQKIIIAIFLPILLLTLLIFYIFEAPNIAFFFGALIFVILLPVFFIWPPLGFWALLILRNNIDQLSSLKLIKIFDLPPFNLESILGIFILVWGISYILVRKINVLRIPFFWPFFVFIVLNTISLTYTSDFNLSLAEWTKTINLFIIYIIICFWIQNKDTSWKTFAKVVGLCSVMPVIFGFWQLFTKTGIYYTPGEVRIFGTFGHPNVFAYFLVLALAILFCDYLSLPKEKRKIISIFGLIAIFILLLFTYARGAWIGIALYLFILGILKYRKQFLATILILVILLGAVFAFSYWTERYKGWYWPWQKVPIVSRVINIFRPTEEENSVSWRLNLWGDMIKNAFIKKPILGWGLGTFPVIRRQTAIVAPGESIEAHNDYIRLACEIGALGLLSYLVLYFGILIKAARRWWRNRKSKKAIFYLSFLAVIIVFMVAGIADNLLKATAVQWILWTYFGIMNAKKD